MGRGGGGSLGQAKLDYTVTVCWVVWQGYGYPTGLSIDRKLSPPPIFNLFLCSLGSLGESIH